MMKCGLLKKINGKEKKPARLSLALSAANRRSAKYVLKEERLRTFLRNNAGFLRVFYRMPAGGVIPCCLGRNGRNLLVSDEPQMPLRCQILLR